MPVSASSKRPSRRSAAPVNDALLVTEQLALEQRLGQRPHVHGDERLAPTRTQPVNRARHQLLAGAALALDEHGARHRRDLLDLDQHLANRLGLADQAGELRQSLPLEPAHGCRPRPRRSRPAWATSPRSPTSRSRSCMPGSDTSVKPTTGTPSHSCCRTSATLAGSSSAPVSTSTSGDARRRSPRTSSIGEMVTVSMPAASSAALRRTAGSTSLMRMATTPSASSSAPPRRDAATRARAVMPWPVACRTAASRRAPAAACRGSRSRTSCRPPPRPPAGSTCRSGTPSVGLIVPLHTSPNGTPP